MFEPRMIVKIDDLYYKAMRCKVKKLKPGLYHVTSPSKTIYTCKIGKDFLRECDCENGLHTIRSGCSHMMAAASERIRELGFDPIWAVPEGYDYKEKGNGVGFFRLGQGVWILYGEKKDETAVV